MIRAAAMALVLAGMTAAVTLAAEQGGEDQCLEAGGVWFGDLGCETNEPQIDRIVVDKSERRLSAYEGDRLVRAFEVSLGRNPVGDKVRQGDARTPEGIYPIVAHNPASSYHLSLRLGYPTPEQVAAAEDAGIDPGGDIMIHGLPNGMGGWGKAHLSRDWTLGCIALTNDEIEWLYRFTPVGAQVEILP